MKAKPALVIGLVVLGLAAWGVWSARQTLAWWSVDHAGQTTALGPVRLDVPAALPAHFRFLEDGSVERASGQLGFDPIDVRLTVLPLGVAVAATDLEAHLEQLRGSMPPAARVDRSGDAPALVDVAKDDEGGEWHTRVLLDGSLVARVDVRVHPSSPDSWREAAARTTASLRIEGDTQPAAVREALGAIAAKACQAGDLRACRNAGEALRGSGNADDAIALLTRAIDKAPSVEGLWANTASAAARLGTERLASGVAAGLAGGDELKRLDDVLALHRLLGALQRGQQRWADAQKTYRAAWRYDTTLACADGLADALTHLVADGSVSEDEAGKLSSQMEERLGHEPRGRIVAARVAATAGDFARARQLITQVFEATEDPDLRREAVSVPISPPPPLEPVTCPAGTESVGTAGAQIETFCVKRGTNVRHGPSRTVSRSSGYPIRETTWTDDEPGPPQRFWWENGVLEKETWAGPDGSILARRYDPLGFVIEEPPPAGTPMPKLPPVFQAPPSP
jgi:tetratricopeptide (TPR) repeat protein